LIDGLHLNNRVAFIRKSSVCLTYNILTWIIPETL